MASTLNQCTFNPDAIGTAQTRNWPMSSCGITNVVTTESSVQRTIRQAGNYSRFFTRVTANVSNGATTIFFRKNTANGNQNVSYAAAETGVKQDLVNTDTVVATDLVNVQIINAGTGNITIVGGSSAFTSSTNTVQAYGFNTASSATAAATTNYYTIGGNLSTLVQADNEIKIGTIGTFKNMGVRVTANTLDVTGSSTFVFLKGGVAGALTIAFASGETGTKEDLVNTDAVVVDDLVCIRQTNTGVAGAITAVHSWVSLETTNFKTDYVSAANSTRIVAQTRFFAFIGTPGASSVESTSQFPAQVASTFSNLRGYVSANTWTANFTITLRKNTANGNSTVVYATTTTGWQHDLVNTDVVVNTDLVNMQHVTSAGAGSVTITNTVITATMAADPTGGSTLLLMGCG